MREWGGTQPPRACGAEEERLGKMTHTHTWTLLGWGLIPRGVRLRCQKVSVDVGHTGVFRQVRKLIGEFQWVERWIEQSFFAFF